MEIQSGFGIIRPEQAPQRGQPERVDARQKDQAQPLEGIVELKPIRNDASDDVLNSARKFQQQTGYDQPETSCCGLPKSGAGSATGQYP